MRTADRSSVPGSALADHVSAHLRDRILSGALRPGEFVRLDRVAEQLGVSPTPVREALQALRAEDMVRLEPRRGFVVAPLQRGDIEDLFAVQAHLTGELAARAAGRVGADELAGLEDLAAAVAAHRGSAERADVDALVADEHHFHAAVNRAAGARKLAWLLGRAAHYLPPRFYATSPSWLAAAVDAHVALLDGLRAGDPAGARRAMERHVLDGRDQLLAHLDAVGMWDEP